MQEECRAIVHRRMPTLVKLLLQSDKEDSTYAYCIQFALSQVESSSKALSTFERVSHNLTDFVDRYLCEQLPHMAETINTLANVIIDDNSMEDHLKLAVLDLMLSVNFKAFRSARIHFKEYMNRRVEILEALAAAQGCSGQESRREIDFFSFRQSLGMLSSNRDPIKESTDRSVDSLRMQTQCVSDMLQTKNFSSMLTRGGTSSDVHHRPLLNQLQKMHDQSCQLFSSIAIARCGDLGSKCRFAVGFGNYLRRKFFNAHQQLLWHGEEGLLIREILSMFFLPGDCHFFKMVNHVIQLRPNAITDTASRQLVLDKFLKPLQYMQMMQLYMNCCESPFSKTERLDTLTSLTGAMRRMIKPVVESLTQFERDLDCEKNQLTLRDLRRATRASFRSLELLWSLAAASYISYSSDFGNESYSRSQHIFCSLSELTAQAQTPKEQARRAYSAALLLHVLQVYCRFLDSWWQLGEFNDWHDEFPAKRCEDKGCSHYVMRTFASGQPYDKICPIFNIIKRHIESAGRAIAALYDSKRLTDFVIKHKTLLDLNLHHLVIQSVYEQLKFYDVQIEKASDLAPDIFWQLKSTEEEQLRCLYYVYYKETILDFTQPDFCCIDELLKRCQNCAVYTPLMEIICQTLEHYLDQRALLLNRYVVYLLRDRLQLAKVLEQLRAVYLLFNFEQLAEYYVIAFCDMERGWIAKAALQLQWVMNKHNHMAVNSSCAFSVALPIVTLEELSLIYSCDRILSCIVTKDHLKCYNEAFLICLQMHVKVHRLKVLQPLYGNPLVTEALTELQAVVLQALEQRLKVQSLKKAASQFEETLQRCERLLDVRAAHHEFVETMASILKLAGHRSRPEVHELVTMAHIVISLWRRIEYIMANDVSLDKQCPFEAQYAVHNTNYVLSVTAVSRTMRCLYPLEDIPK